MKEDQDIYMAVD